MSIETVTPKDVEMVRERVIGSFRIHGELFKDTLDNEIQLMIGWRVHKKEGFEGFSLPENPDEHKARGLVYDQRACEIYQGEIFIGKDVWETHEDIRERGEIPPTKFRVSAELFYLRNLPRVPIIRLDADLSREEIDSLNNTCVLLDPYYKLVE